MAKTPGRAAALAFWPSPDGPRVLLVRASSGRWILPKGCLERGETTEDAAVRETVEEAGVRVVIDPTVKPRTWQSPRGRTAVHAALAVNVDTGGEPGRDPRWFRVDKAVRKIGRHDPELARIVGKLARQYQAA